MSESLAYLRDLNVQQLAALEALLDRMAKAGKGRVNLAALVTEIRKLDDNQVARLASVILKPTKSETDDVSPDAYARLIGHEGPIASFSMPASDAPRRRRRRLPIDDEEIAAQPPEAVQTVVPPQRQRPKSQQPSSASARRRKGGSVGMAIPSARLVGSRPQPTLLDPEIPHGGTHGR